jgi:hypothetical protein
LPATLQCENFGSFIDPLIIFEIFRNYCEGIVRGGGICDDNLIVLVLLVEEGVEGEGDLSVHCIVSCREDRADEGAIIAFQIVFMGEELEVL